MLFNNNKLSAFGVQQIAFPIYISRSLTYGFKMFIFPCHFNFDCNIKKFCRLCSITVLSVEHRVSAPADTIRYSFHCIQLACYVTFTAKVISYSMNGGKLHFYFINCETQLYTFNISLITYI